MANDLTGSKFGRLTVLRRGPNKGMHSGWVCACECGNETVVASNDLKKGGIKSCSCYRRDRISAQNRINPTTGGETHGMTGAPEYRSWCAMHARCKSKGGYVDRGIKVCRRWSKFENFLADMGCRPEGCTLERSDNNKGYSKSNCVWATPKQQQNNTRSNRTLTWKGRTMTVAQWADETGINYQTLSWRVRNGWSVERAITTRTVSPVGKTVHFEVDYT